MRASASHWLRRGREAAPAALPHYTPRGLLADLLILALALEALVFAATLLAGGAGLAGGADLAGGAGPHWLATLAEASVLAQGLAGLKVVCWVVCWVACRAVWQAACRWRDAKRQAARREAQRAAHWESFRARTPQRTLRLVLSLVLYLLRYRVVRRALYFALRRTLNQALYRATHRTAQQRAHRGARRGAQRTARREAARARAARRVWQRMLHRVRRFTLRLALRIALHRMLRGVVYLALRPMLHQALYRATHPTQPQAERRAAHQTAPGAAHRAARQAQHRARQRAAPGARRKTRTAARRQAQRQALHQTALAALAFAALYPALAGVALAALLPQLGALAGLGAAAALAADLAVSAPLLWLLASRAKARARARALARECARRGDRLRQNRLRHHFLFNSLNTVAALIDARPAAAENSLLDLAELARAMLRQQPRASLAEEIALGRRYLRLERARLGARLKVKWRVSGAGVGRARPPAPLLQPLLENAVRHGVESRARGGVVRVEIVELERAVRVEVRNPVRAGRRRRGRQLAHAALRRRLRDAYGDRCRFVCTLRRGEYRVVLELPKETCQPQGAYEPRPPRPGAPRHAATRKNPAPRAAKPPAKTRRIR